MSERAVLLEHHRRMLEIREFEDEVMRLFARNLVRGSTHLCQGQEAVTVGACSALRRGRHDDLHLPRPRRRAGDGRAA